jgi:putative nucleotidyltransferase with HDIG domain
MHPILNDLIQGISLSGNIEQDMLALQTATGHANVAEHCQRVSAEAMRLAKQFGADLEKARIAGLLHDISDIIPLSGAVVAGKKFGLKLFPEEERFPMILHQRLSVVVAREVFHVEDAEILSAIECHITLKPRRIYWKRSYLLQTRSSGTSRGRTHISMGSGWQWKYLWIAVCSTTSMRCGRTGRT